MAKYCRRMILGVETFLLQPSTRMSEGEVAALEAFYGEPIPGDYREMLLTVGEFEGFIGSVEGGSYLRMVGCQEAIDLSAAYELPSEMIFVGSDGGGEAYVLEKSSDMWLEIPFLDICEYPDNRLIRRFQSLTNMLQELSVGT